MRSIRNTQKRSYALAYLLFLEGKQEEQGRGGLSYMAAQAVRLTLHEYKQPGVTN